MTEIQMDAILDLQRRKAIIRGCNRRIRAQMETASDGLAIDLQIQLWRNWDDMARLIREQAAIQAEA